MDIKAVDMNNRNAIKFIQALYLIWRKQLRLNVTIKVLLKYIHVWDTSLTTSTVYYHVLVDTYGNNTLYEGGHNSFGFVLVRCNVLTNELHSINIKPFWNKLIHWVNVDKSTCTTILWKLYSPSSTSSSYYY